MKNLIRGALVAAVTLLFGCGAGTDDSTIGTSSQELRDGTLLGYDFTATVTPTIDCTAQTVTLTGILYSAGSGTEVEVTWGDALMGVITEKDLVSIGNSIKSANYSFTLTTFPTDGTYNVCFTQAGYGGRATKQFCQAVVVACGTI